ncbi:hypothetical protein E8E12_007333 [Didymella heteroderae]|uniref:Uncharacterized protein n=1 Tax=Didymella heteroderae TaxID=1769908 RepID=A0A9P5C379_9PLEO|nr:hypothetical protein E8E12_007333 [Didymella heteroderae]
MNASRARRRAYTAHALVLFDAYGILLSSGIWLEYHFTTLHPTTPLVALSTIAAAQIACLGLAIGISTRLHARSPHYWRRMMATGALLVCGAYVALLTNTDNDVRALVLWQGALTGLGVGVLCATSLRVLSTHYRHDIATASRVCVAAGFGGAGIYTVAMWCCLRAERARLGYGSTLLLLGATLLPAIWLTGPSSEDEVKSWSSTPRDPHSRDACRTPLTLLAQPLILTFSLIPPLYLPLLLARHPGPYRADTGVYILLAIHCTAGLASAFVPRVPSNRLSACLLCGAASVLSGTAIIPLIWMFGVEVTVPCAVVYGAGLGTVCTLWMTMLMECGNGVAMGRVGWLSAFALVLGLCTGGAVVGVAAVLQGCKKGVGITLGALAGCLILSGLGFGIGGVVRHWKRR